MIVWRSIGFYAAIFLPSALFLLADTSSLAAGAVLAALLAIGVALPMRQEFLPLQKSNLILALLCSSIIMIHLIFASAIWSISLGRTLISLAASLILFFGATTLSISFLGLNHHVVKQVCWIIFCLMIFLLIASLLNFYPSTIFGMNKVVFPFSEPSHFALAFVPFLMFVCVTSSGWRSFGLLCAGVVLAYWVQNLTMMVGCLLVALICARLVFLPILLITVLTVGLMLDLTYFTERLNFTGETSNLSALVYLQGWELVKESMELTSNWGLGFQQLGLQPTSVPTAETIYQISGSELNQIDGGFLLAKFVSEFGVLGILVVGGLSLFIGTVAIKLRSIANGRYATSAEIFSCCVIVSFLLEIYVRGVGYYSGTVLLFLMSAHYYFRGDEIRRLENTLRIEKELKPI